MYVRSLILLGLSTVFLKVMALACGAEEWDEGIARTARNYGPIPLITLGVEYENFAIGPHSIQGEFVLRVCRDPQASTDVTVVTAVPQPAIRPQSPQSPPSPPSPPSLQGTQLELKQLHYGCGDIEGGQFFVKLITSKFAGLAGIIERDSRSGWANVRLKEGYGGDHVLVNVRTPQKYIIKIPELVGDDAYKVQFEVYNNKFPSGRKGWLHSKGGNARAVKEARKIVVLQTQFEDEARDEEVSEKTVSYARCDSSIVNCEARDITRDKNVNSTDWLDGEESSD